MANPRRFSSIPAHTRKSWSSGGQRGLVNYNSTALALIVDYADRGDQQDHADWLGARFITGEQ